VYAHQRGINRDYQPGHSGSLSAVSSAHVQRRVNILGRVDAVRLDAKRLAALAHPIRVFILQATETAAASPSDVAVALGEPLGVVAYHFRVLHNVGLIELTATERRRGSVQSFYRAAGPGWGELASRLRVMVGEGGDGAED
jgi:DNA-binding transcriptional ArsR family regulator